MTQASVKGLLLGGVVVNLRRLCERGALTDADLEARLGRPAIALLGEKIDPALWYPLDAYRELVDLLWQVEGGRNPDYMREKGRAWAKKLYDAHRYQQLEYSAEHAKQIDSNAEAVRQGRLIASLVQTFWNFVESKVDLDPDQPNTLRMVIEGTAPLPDANRYTTEGFLNHMIERGGGSQRASSERPSANRVVFRLPLSVRKEGTR